MAEFECARAKRWMMEAMDRIRIFQLPKAIHFQFERKITISTDFVNVNFLQTVATVPSEILDFGIVILIFDLVSIWLLNTWL